MSERGDGFGPRAVSRKRIRFQKRWSMRAPLRWRLIEILINASLLLYIKSGNNLTFRISSKIPDTTRSCNPHFTSNKRILIFWRQVFWNFVNAVRAWKLMNYRLLYYWIIFDISLSYFLFSVSRFLFFLEPFIFEFSSIDVSIEISIIISINWLRRCFSPSFLSRY